VNLPRKDTAFNSKLEAAFDELRTAIYLEEEAFMKLADRKLKPARASPGRTGAARGRETMRNDG